MRRQMVRFLQKRKFRLVTRWKTALKDNIGTSVLLQNSFPYTLIFRAFDDLMRLLKQDGASVGGEPGTEESFLASVGENVAPLADQYMELFLSGRDVLIDFVAHDPSFCGAFAESARRDMRARCEHAFKHLIDREMREYARRYSSGPASLR